MPVKLPDLPKHESQAPLSVGRIPKSIDTPNSLPAMHQQSKDVQNIGDQLVQYQDKVEADAADAEATKRASEYEVSFRRKLYGDGQTAGVKFQEGDPTPAYQQFDSDMDEEYKRLTDVSDFSPRAAQLINQRVTDRANQLQLTRLSEYGAQSARYQDQVYSSDIDLKKQALATDGASLIQAGDDSSFKVFDDLYGGIRNTNIRKALANHTAVRDDANGDIIYHDDTTNETYKVSMSPIAQIDMNKDLSEGTYNAMNVLLKSGQVDKANALKERYGDSLDAYKKAQIADDFERATVEEKAYLLAAHPDQKKKILSGLNEAMAAKVQDHADSIKETRQARAEQRQQRSDKLYANRTFQIINDAKNGDRPFVSLQDGMENPTFKEAYDKISDPKIKQAIVDAMQRPKYTSGVAKARMNDLILGNKDGVTLRGMSPDDLEIEKRGLSPGDAKTLDRQWTVMNSENGDQIEKKNKISGKLLKDEFMRVNKLTEDEFNRISGAEFDKFQNWRNEFVDTLPEDQMTTKEIETSVRQFVASKVLKQQYKPIVYNRFQGREQTSAEKKSAGTFNSVTGGTNKVLAQGPTPPPKNKMTAPQARVAFIKQFNREPTPQQLEDFMKGQ